MAKKKSSFAKVAASSQNEFVFLSESSRLDTSKSAPPRLGTCEPNRYDAATEPWVEHEATGISWWARWHSGDVAAPRPCAAIDSTDRLYQQSIGYLSRRLSTRAE